MHNALREAIADGVFRGVRPDIAAALVNAGYARVEGPLHLLTRHGRQTLAEAVVDPRSKPKEMPQSDFDSYVRAWGNADA